MNLTLRELFTAHDLTAFIDVFEGEHVAIADLPGISDQELADSFGLRGYGDRKRFRAMTASLGKGSGAPSSPSTTDPGATRAGPLPVDPGATRAARRDRFHPGYRIDALGLRLSRTMP